MYSFTYLPNSQMAETSDEFGLVQSVRGHFHAPHGLHLPVHLQKFSLRDGDIQ